MEVNLVSFLLKSNIDSANFGIKSFYFLLIMISGTSAFGLNSDKVVGANACGECHVSELDAWKNTHHFKTFTELHRRPKAKEIQKKLGLKRIKSESDCMSCHYTTQSLENKLKAISGISCESCHGAAKDWIDIHNNFGGPGVTRESETADHKKTRLAKIAAAGMIRPDEIYKLASNCFQCHTVPNENLVNVGGHKAGSNFELVSWLQGEVRHNFTFSEDKDNREASPERKRILYVTGRILDLEHAFRGVAKATQKASYAVSMAKRAKRAIIRLEKINELKPTKEITEILVIAKAQKLKLNNENLLTAAANKIALKAESFLKLHNGDQLALLDPLIPTPEKYKGTPHYNF